MDVPKEFTNYSGNFSEKAMKTLRAQAIAYNAQCKLKGLDTKVTVRWNTFTAPGKGTVQSPTYTVKLK